MKKFLKLAAVALVSSLTLVSCGDDDDNGSSSSNPSIFLVNQNEGFITADVSVAPSENIKFSIQANENTETNENLRQVTVIRTIGGVETTVLDSAFNAKSFTHEIDAVSNANSNVETWTFTVTDRKERSDSYEVIVTVQGLAVETGDIRHIAGPNGCLGSFDLVNATALPSSAADANKDIVNTDAAGVAFTGSLESKNGTTFKEVTGLTAGITYNNANTAAALESAYNNAGGVEGTSIEDPSTGDIYAVKLRGGSDYAIIRIENVDADDVSCNASATNKGILEFEYKINRD